MGNVDCVILDLQLPDSAGRETFEKINERFPDVPVIVMTHNKDRNLAIEMIQAGAADYVLKDFTNEEDIFRRIVFSVEKHRRTVRMPTEKVAAVHQLDRARAEMMTAHQSGEHMAIQNTTVATTSAVADLSRKMFTELQMLSSKMAQSEQLDKNLTRIVENLETELLRGQGGRPSMRSQVDLVDHRISQVEKRFSDFRELTDKQIGAVRSEMRSNDDSQRMSVVQIHQTHMTNRTKILLGILGFLGVVASALATYEAASHGGHDSSTIEKPTPAEKAKP